MITQTDNPALRWYLAGWLAFCGTAAGIVVCHRYPDLGFLRRYTRFLLMPWKMAVFLPAFSFVTLAGRWTDDETWDVITGAGMSLLTFLTAPLSIGLAYRVLRGRLGWRYLWVAAALTLFSRNQRSNTTNAERYLD